tara:strand:- start:187904 stop:189292 length:1389 start_codon:yes stop_codon:yes gene_type:complete
VRLINRGGQGSVFLGYDKRQHRPVAIKIYPFPALRSARNRLREEARLVAGLKSPKIVPVLDVIESRKHLALVAQYIPGCDLEEYLSQTRPCLSSVLSIATDIAGALAIARQSQVVHGDVKARNILINQSGRALLTDFGIARGHGEAARPGSKSAQSPEHYLGQALDVRSDLFALGCLMYRMLGGVRPFYRDACLDHESMLRANPQPLQELIPPEEVVPAELVALVHDMMQRDPQARPRNTHRVRQVLQRSVEGIPLALGNTVLREARPFFRHEDPEDIPPLVPPELADRARSSLPPAGGFSLLQRLLRLDGRSRLGLLALLVSLLVVLVWMSQQQQPIRVFISAPVIEVTPGAPVPEQLSKKWLVQLVADTVREKQGTVHFVGPIGATPNTVHYAAGAAGSVNRVPRDSLALDLRCTDATCVLVVSRERDGLRNTRSAVLLPDMRADDWQRVVRDTTASLYP